MKYLSFLLFFVLFLGKVHTQNRSEKPLKIDVRYFDETCKTRFVKNGTYLGKDSLSIMLKKKEHLSVQLKGIQYMTMRGKTRKGLGAALGILAGAAIGIGGGFLAQKECDDFLCLDEKSKPIVFGLAGIAFGGYIGYQIGVRPREKITVADLP